MERRRCLRTPADILQVLNDIPDCESETEQTDEDLFEIEDEYNPQSVSSSDSDDSCGDEQGKVCFVK